MTRPTISTMAAAVVAIGALMLPCLAHAEDWQDRVHWADKAFGTPPNVHARPYRVPAADQPRARVRSYVRRLPHPVDKPAYIRQHQIDTACKPAIRVVGDQRPTEQGAREQADKAWMQEARFRHGERVMDIAVNARDIRYACTRSSVGEIASVTQHRCEVIAIPCPAPLLWIKRP